MQNLTEKVFKLAPPGGLFNETVIRNLFPDSSDGARALLVHRACAAREVLRLPQEVEPIAFTPRGYPADKPRPKKRKALAALVRHERW